MARPTLIPTSIPGFGCIYRRGLTWWMKYKTGDGMSVRKSTHQRDQAAAFSELMRQAGRRASGEMCGSDPERVTFDALFDLLESDYIRKQRASLADTKARVAKHLRPFFGSMRVMDLRKRDIRAFVDSCLSQELKPSTINKMLAFVRRSMSLGAKEDPILVLRIPGWFEKLPEDNVRTGILSPEVYRALLAELVPHAGLALVLGYHLGMRRGEMLSLKWDQVDLAAGVIRLQRKQTKSKKPRVAPIYGEMAAYLDMARSAASARCPYVIQVDGKRVHDIKTAWIAGCRRAGVGKVLVHDLRRTAATNMDAAGISRERIMDCVGWETDSMFRRYNIGSDLAAKQTGRQMDEWLVATKKTGREAKDKPRCM